MRVGSKLHVGKATWRNGKHEIKVIYKSHWKSKMWGRSQLKLSVPSLCNTAPFCCFLRSFCQSIKARHWNPWQSQILQHCPFQNWIIRSFHLEEPARLFHHHSLSATSIPAKLRYLRKYVKFLVSSLVGLFRFLVWAIKLRRRASPVTKPLSTTKPLTSKFIPGN